MISLAENERAARIGVVAHSAESSTNYDVDTQKKEQKPKDL